ncbi:imidazole glycerol phosphate synthase, glutamine amidotransferase subunit [Pirellula staleyi DSM 6068]|uniref:Imidazole glycerol phosphate synthase subunit HisH n=1 Tax=Pirellula staleyi (strain ATCC 27377 / DSM 6068 / ICPB 4128) TaxID=530564 RepID=D2R5Y3_PIRSD|nr:imidazole glycerol phosphate synthase subunit HisH [Pirellula staleyi]ADB19068.1 imidazole glycerol phosphate synthase, glutamine amidotransferase subunit [Pirellula staleyi DSM 6068]
MAEIAIIDYQMGNLRSVQKGFERVGHHAVVTSDPAEIAQASRVVLPGVGAFGDAITELRRRDLVSVIRDIVARGTPMLGICLGLQMLFDVGYEGGEFEGLGILAGKCVRFHLPAEFKVPHMGWNRSHIVRPNALLSDIADNSYFYYVHSYYVVPTDANVIAVQADYGHPFCAMIAKGQLFATQFHPEKSQATGLKLLQNFAEIPVLQGSA